MKKAVQQTSINAFYEEKSRNVTKKMQVLKHIREQGTVTDHDLMRLTGWQRNIVSARRRELVLEGLVVECGVVFDVETRKSVLLWEIKKQ